MAPACFECREAAGDASCTMASTRLRLAGVGTLADRPAVELYRCRDCRTWLVRILIDHDAKWVRA